MAKDPVDRFFESLAGEESTGDADAAATATRSALLRRIEQSESRELTPADVAHREDLIAQWRRQELFADRQDPADGAPGEPLRSGAAGWIGNVRRMLVRYRLAGPRLLLIAVMLLIIILSLLAGEDAQNPPAGNARPAGQEVSPREDPSHPNTVVSPAGLKAPESVAPTPRLLPEPSKDLPAAPPSAGSTEQPARSIHVLMTNVSGKMLDNFYVQRADASETRRELLGQTRIQNGGQFEIVFQSDKGCLYTMIAEFSDGNQQQQRNIDVCSVTTLEWGQ